MMRALLRKRFRHANWCVRALISFGFVGPTTTIGLAWLCEVISAKQVLDSPIYAIIVPFSHRDTSHVSLRIRSCTNFGSLFIGQTGGSSCSEPVCSTAPPDALFPRLVQQSPLRTSVLVDHLVKCAADPAVSYRDIWWENVYGWPLYCLRAYGSPSRILSPRIAVVPPSDRLLSTPPNDRVFGQLTWRWVGASRQFSIEPIWPGIAVNILALGTATTCILTGVDCLACAAIGIYRQTRCKCPNCGYDHSGSIILDVCPECGFPVGVGPAP